MSLTKKEILKLRGAEAFRQIIEASGGLYSTKQVAVILGIAPRSVCENLESGNLLAVSYGEIEGFPEWQFDGSFVIEHFVEVM